MIITTQTLTIAKIIYTLIWIIFNVVLSYMVYTVIKIDELVLIGIVLIIIGGIVLLVFNKISPLAIIARKYSGLAKDNLDIYLPIGLRKITVDPVNCFIMIICCLVYIILNR